jgi:hypothetical protein
MLEYGEAYLSENERILAAMDARMSRGAAALAEQMALEEAEEEALDEAA